MQRQSIFKDCLESDVHHTILEGRSSNLFDIRFFEPSVMGGGGAMRAPYNNFVIAPMILKFGTGVKLDVFYTVVTKICDMTIIRHYDVITCILADV